MQLVEKPFSCTNLDGLTIRGIHLCRDDRTGKLPCIIISHGFTATVAKETRPFALHMAELGFRVFAYDFCGGALDSTSDGSFEDYMTPVTEMGDLRAVFSYVSARDDVDIERIILEGHSQGGFVSSQVAPELDGRIAALALMYPAMCIPDDARAGSMQAIQFDPANIPDHIGEPPMRVCGEYARCVIDLDPYAVLGGYHGPVYLSHGTSDSIVPFPYAERTYETYRANGNDVTFKPIEGSDHGFHGEYLAKSLALIDPFYKQFL